MIQFIVVEESNGYNFAAQIQAYLNDGWTVSWSGAVPAGNDYSSYAIHIAHLSKES